MSKREFTPSQSKAISHTGSDILISAGAGSGKTATLTERIIRRVLDGDDITKKLVVTFTKEAANELKGRITDELAKKLKEFPDNEHLRSQIVKINSADISTIHSFCLKVIRPNFDKLPIDSDFRIGEESEIEYIKGEVMKDVIEELFEADTPSEDFLLVSDCYSQISQSDALDEKLLTLYNNLSSTALFLDTLLISQKSDGDFMGTEFGSVLLDEIVLFTKHLRPIYEKIIDDIMSYDGTPKYLSAFTSDLDLISRLENATQGATYLVLKNIFDSYSPLPLNGIKNSNIEDVEFAKEAREDLKKRVKKFKEDYFAYSQETLEVAFTQNNKICKAMYNILSKFEEKFKERKRKYGLCDFNDLERYTYLLLCNSDGTPTSLAREIALEYDEIYIDEYQDTNSLQDAIFSAISRNNRFMVGDIKQSIYRFRSAEPEIFSHYRTAFKDITSCNDEGEGGKTIFMSDNFRCDESVINFTNEVSDYMFFNSVGIPYEKQDNLVYKKINDGVHKPQECEIRILDRALLEGDDDEDEEEQNHELLQARYVAKRIAYMLENNKLPNDEAIKCSDIAILIRKGRFKSYYINALRELGIDAEYVDNVKFFEKPHVLLLLSLLNAIDNSYKDTYLAGALSSPIFGFSMDELLTIRNYSDKRLPLYSALLSYAGDEKITEKIGNFKSKLEKMQDDIKKMNAYEAVSYAMNVSGLISSTSKTERKDLIKLYNHAREYEKGSYKGLYKFLCYIEGIKASQSKETVFTNPDNCVRIMSIHASKGLEFEICFLCNTESGFSMQDTRDAILFERHLGIAGYIGNTGSLVKYNTLLRKLTAKAIDRASKEEEMRVLYVAMTRARSKLIVTASSPNVGKELAKTKLLAPYTSEAYVYSLKSPIEYILNTFYMPRDYVNFDIVDPNTLVELSKAKAEEVSDLDESKIAEIQDVLRERFDFKYEYDYLNKIPSKLSVSRLKPNLLDETENDEIDLTKALDSKPKFLSLEEIKISGADRGTATHVFMQFCDFNSLEKNGYEAELKRLLDNAFISKGDSEIINKSHIEAFAKSALFDMMKNAKMIKREFRFNVMLPATEFTSDAELKKQKVLVQGVIDSVFENENGELILVDYKTDKVTSNDYKEVLTSRYTNQLSYYKKAIELIFERPVKKVLIYSVPLAKEVELK